MALWADDDDDYDELPNKIPTASATNIIIWNFG